MVKLETAEYKISDGKVWITMSINFENRCFTLQTKSGKCDFVFLDSKTDVAAKVQALMREATEFADNLLLEHADKKLGV